MVTQYQFAVRAKLFTRFYDEIELLTSCCSLISRSYDDHNSKWFLNGLRIWDILNVLNVSQGPSDNNFKWPLNGHTISVLLYVQRSPEVSLTATIVNDLWSHDMRVDVRTPWAFHRVLLTTVLSDIWMATQYQFCQTCSALRSLMTTTILNDFWSHDMRVDVCPERFTGSYWPVLNDLWMVTQCQFYQTSRTLHKILWRPQF